MSQGGVEFEWSDQKAKANLRKHGVSFEEAQTAFEDPFALIVEDVPHADLEPREILIGYSERPRLLFISFVERHFQRVPIISARLADRKERRDYEEKRRF